MASIGEDPRHQEPLGEVQHPETQHPHEEAGEATGVWGTLKKVVGLGGGEKKHEEGHPEAGAGGEEQRGEGQEGGEGGVSWRANKAFQEGAAQEGAETATSGELKSHHVLRAGAGSPDSDIEARVRAQKLLKPQVREREREGRGF